MFPVTLLDQLCPSPGPQRVELPEIRSQIDDTGSEFLLEIYRM
jgi:hypothetical protein